MTAERVNVAGAMSAIEMFMERGWTDGLPIVPPTPGRVAALLEAAGLDPDHALGTVPERRRVITAEKAAINAVMAGCLPIHFPLLVTMLEAVCDPAFGAHGPNATTAGSAVLTVVNGPIRGELGLNSGANLFGPGNRANAVLGRALRLVLRNVCGSTEAQFDRGCLSHPGRYTFCIAEDEEASGWTPLHVQRGLHPEQSAVTVLAADGPNQIVSHASSDPEALLAPVADRMRALGTLNLREGDGECALVVSPEPLAALCAAGWSKEQVRGWVWERARRTVAELKRGGVLPGPVAPGDEEHFHYAAQSPEDILTVVGGGPAGTWFSYIPGWTGRRSSRAVTRAVALTPRRVPWPSEELVSEVLDPTAGPVAMSTRPARRRPLKGIVVGLLDNGKPNSRETLEIVGEHLVRQYGAAGLVRITKETPYRPATPMFLSLLAERCGAVVTGVGD